MKTKTWVIMATSICITIASEALGQSRLTNLIKSHQTEADTVTVQGGNRFNDVSSGNIMEPSTHGTACGHRYVDLGLPSGIKWADKNVGASSPTDFGEYFSWGEVSPKREYTLENCQMLDWQYGSIEGGDYDAAATNWCTYWRIPSDEDFYELRKHCSWEFVTIGNTKGFKITGPNGNYIFLPAAGSISGGNRYDTNKMGDYMTSTYSQTKKWCCIHLMFVRDDIKFSNSPIYDGMSVRPVLN